MNATAKDRRVLSAPNSEVPYQTRTIPSLEHRVPSSNSVSDPNSEISGKLREVCLDWSTVFRRLSNGGSGSAPSHPVSHAPDSPAGDDEGVAHEGDGADEEDEGEQRVEGDTAGAALDDSQKKKGGGVQPPVSNMSSWLNELVGGVCLDRTIIDLLN